MVAMFRSDPDPSCPGLDIPGWMTPGEMRWLHNQASQMHSICEIGCLVGRSTIALASACRGPVYAIDCWEGDNAGAYPQFLANTRQYQNIIAMRQRSVDAAPYVSAVDMIFIDGDHSELGIRSDLGAWFRKAKIMVAGHDFGHPDYPFVEAVVREYFGGRHELVQDESIWYYRKSASYSVVIPNRFEDIIAPLIKSIREHGMPYRCVIIADGHTRQYNDIETIPCANSLFTFPLSANQGIRAVAPEDPILVNDDIRLLEDNTFGRLAAIAATNPKIGILSPLIKGCAGNPIQRWHEREQHWAPEQKIKFQHGTMPICFPCVWLSRRMLEEIGLLNEGIVTYGRDDDELCMRARATGWLTAVTSEVVVQHGDGGPELGEGRGKTWSLSFARREYAG